MNTGATLNGRILAQAAQTVTLAGNTITQPVCAASSGSGTGATTRADQATAPQYVCPTIPVGVTAPSILETSRVSSTSIFLSWGPYTGTDRFNVRYGPADGNWLYNTDVTGFSTTLNYLPANQPMWFQVAARNECQIGSYGPSASLGGQVGGPRLPNTGYAPSENRNSLYIAIGFFSGITILLVSILRKN